MERTRLAGGGVNSGLQDLLPPQSPPLLRNADPGFQGNGVLKQDLNNLHHANARQTKDFIKFLGLVAILYLGIPTPS